MSSSIGLKTIEEGNIEKVLNYIAEQEKTTYTGAELLVKKLEDHGVDNIFGFIGGSIMPIYENIKKSNIEFIRNTHEQHGAHAAEGYAKSSGKPGICIATSGPGATNFVTGIADCCMDSVPVIAITGQVPTTLIGTSAFQETDVVSIFEPITKKTYQITDPQEISYIIDEAFYIATSKRPGPVLIDFPVDMQKSEAQYNETEIAGNDNNKSTEYPLQEIYCS